MKSNGSTLHILVVGDVRQWLSDGRHLPRVSRLDYISLDDLDQACLDRTNPDVVLCPLVAKGFDALDVALRLQELKFDGRMRAICPPLPDPQVVLREVHILCPELDFNLLEIDTSLQADEKPPKGRLS